MTDEQPLRKKSKGSFGFCSHHRKGHEDYYKHTIRIRLGSHETRLCARCTGIYVGLIASTISFLLFGYSILPFPLFRQVLPIGSVLTLVLMILLSLPLMIDWGMQKASWYERESTNLRRVYTGLCLGVALCLFQFTWDIYLISIAVMGLYTGIMLVLTKFGHVRRKRMAEEKDS